MAVAGSATRSAQQRSCHETASAGDADVPTTGSNETNRVFGDEDAPSRADGRAPWLGVPPFERQRFDALHRQRPRVVERAGIADGLASESRQRVGVIPRVQIEGNLVERTPVMDGLPVPAPARRVWRQPVPELVEQGVSGIVWITPGGDRDRAGVMARQPGRERPIGAPPAEHARRGNPCVLADEQRQLDRPPRSGAGLQVFCAPESSGVSRGSGVSVVPGVSAVSGVSAVPGMFPPPCLSLRKRSRRPTSSSHAWRAASA